MSGASGRRRWAILDRDGTVIFDRHYLSDPDGVELLPNAAAGLRSLRDAGFGLLLATNQSGIARGYFDERAFWRVQARLAELLAADGLAFYGVFVCPHGPEDGCACRKPKPGLLLGAASTHGFAPADAVMIGDGEADMGAARAARVLGIQIAAGGRPASAPADHLAADLAEAARIAIAALGARESTPWT